MGAPNPIPWHTLSVLLQYLLACKALKSAGGRGASLVVQWLRIHLLMQGRHRFNPWSGKIPYAVGQLSLCSTTSEPAL